MLCRTFVNIRLQGKFEISFKFDEYGTCRALAEEKKKAEEQAKKDEAARKAELARQEALAAQAAAERAAELERKAEEARKVNNMSNIRFQIQTRIYNIYNKNTTVFYYHQRNNL